MADRRGGGPTGGLHVHVLVKPWAGYTPGDTGTPKILLTWSWVIREQASSDGVAEAGAGIAATARKTAAQRRDFEGMGVSFGRGGKNLA